MPYDHKNRAFAMNAYEIQTNVVVPNRAQSFLSLVGGCVGFDLQPVNPDLLFASGVTGVECRANPVSTKPPLRRIVRYGLNELIVTRQLWVFRRHYTSGQISKRIKPRRSERGV